jgi:hypothetical protein
MNKFTISFFFFFLSIVSFAQQRYSSYGGPFTPRGDIRFLLIFAGFENECDGSTEGIWPDRTPMQGNEIGKGFPVYYDQLFYSDFSQFRPGAPDKTISNFYYQMSSNHPDNPPLRIVADIFPERINIKGDIPDNVEVFKIIQERYPNFDWSKYDNRKNFPDFKFDNSLTGADGMLDYIMVFWRKKGTSGYAGISSFRFRTESRGKEEFFSTHSSCGFTLTQAISDNVFQLKRAFHHEFAHTLFNCPHLFGTNDVTGNYFYASAGWGIMYYGFINSSANAWESWYNGWIELPQNRDLKDYSQNGIYTLRDFVTTGDAMRIKLPFANQYLWIENHAGLSHFDERDAYFTNGNGDSIPPSPKGILMFIENISGSRNKIITPLSSEYAGGLKAMHAGGNFDYTAQSFIKDPAWWNNIIVDFNELRSNPTSAHNDLCLIRGNYAFDTIFPDKIIYRRFTNNRGEPCMMCKGDCLHGLRQECAEVVKKSGSYVYGSLGLNMAFGNDLLPRKVGISSNPVIINHQKYNCKENKLDPIYLNGISITILKKGEHGEITFEVRFDDTEISRDQRMTGELVLNDIPNAYFDIFIREKKSLTIDRSGNPNRDNQGESHNGEHEFPDFVNPSSLTIERNARILIDKKAKLQIRQGTLLKVKSGAEIVVRGKLIVGAGCRLEVEKGGKIEKQGKGKIKISKKAFPNWKVKE